MRAIPIFLIENIEFDRLLGSGTFNNVYLSKTNQYVFKQPKIKSPLTPNSAIPFADIPENAVLVWNSINGAKLGAAKVVTNPYYGWLCPYVAGNTPTSKEVANEIINIYADTKRILYDAHQLKNFVKRKSDKKIFCIDLGLAILPAAIQIFDTESFSVSTTSPEKDIEKCLDTHIARIKRSESVKYANEEPSVTVLALEYLAHHYPLLTAKEIKKLADNEKLLLALKNAYLVGKNEIKPSGNKECEYLRDLGMIYYYFHAPVFSVNPHEAVFHTLSATSTQLRTLKESLIFPLKKYIKINNARWIHNKQLSFAKNALATQLLSLIQNASNEKMIIEALNIAVEKNRKVSAYFANQNEKSAKLGAFGITLQKMVAVMTAPKEQEGEARKM